MAKQLIDNDWQDILQDEFDKDYYKELRSFLKEAYQERTIYPEMHHIYEALQVTSFANTKVVILGQDPYHGPNQAHGLSFSVQPEVAIPRSLVNIYKELADDIGCPIPTHGYLKRWAEQGVLLLNTALTVEAHQAASHRGKGWEHFTDRVIESLNEKRDPVVFILWGKHAQEKQKLIDTEKHYTLTSVHPSPLSARRGFFGSKPFSKTNEILENNGLKPIDWCLPDL
ncbi:uracil-DNA glycosylase [Terribacillus saccharophilus]|uniref:uracil-DNA glycosylase n=1 Tax=Terribacillus saccharophilus TaxID=361277 RepID=UPI00298A01B0|nr:uracil-DNA glycosylase [Terribacillus saccharophilus]MCM3227065.1 uracil-DNA glycosylase [Terribacillus saccharophilus]